MGEQELEGAMAVMYTGPVYDILDSKHGNTGRSAAQLLLSHHFSVC